MLAHNGAAAATHADAFKNQGKGLAACREKRLEGSVQLRKRRREETLARLRHLENTAEEEVLKQRAVYDDTLIAELFDDDDAIKALWTYHAHMKPDDPENTAVAEVMSMGLHDQFLEIFNRCWPNSDLEVPSVAVIADIAADFEYLPLMVACPKFLSRVKYLLTSSKRLEVVRDLLFIARQVTSMSLEVRNACIAEGFMQLTVDLYPSLKGLELKRLALATLNAFFVYEMPRDRIPKALVELTRGALVAESDATLLYNALTLFANIVPEAIATEVLQERLVLRRLCELMAYRQPDVACAAIDLVAEVASFDTDATKYLHDERVFDAVWRVLESPMAKTCAEVECSASAAIRRFVQTDAPHFSSVLAARYVPRFMDVLKNAPFRMRREIVRSVHMLLMRGSAATIELVIKGGAVPVLCDMLTVMDVETVLATLASIEHILLFGQTAQMEGATENPMKRAVEEHGGVDRLEFLLNSQNIDVYLTAHELVSTYFEKDDAMDDAG